MDNSTITLIQDYASTLKKAYYGVQYLMNNKIEPCEEVYFKVSQILHDVANKQQTVFALVGHDFTDVFSWKPNDCPFELKEGVLLGDLKEAHNYLSSSIDASQYEGLFLKSYLQCCLKEVKPKGASGGITKTTEQRVSIPSANSSSMVLPLFQAYA